MEKSMTIVNIKIFQLYLNTSGFCY